MKRRQFLINNLLLLGSGLLPGMAIAKTAAVESRGRPLLADALTRENFTAYQGEKFVVYGGEGARQVEILRLVDVVEMGSDEITEQFWLHFETAAGSTLEQDVYNFEHPEAGKFQLWLEPGETTGETITIWVRFNMLKNFDSAMVPVGISDTPIA